MKIEVTNSIYRLFLMVPMISWMGLAACSDLASTAGKENLGPYRVATYVEDTKPRSEDRTTNQDPGPAYEWFY
jgi:hypothetical protein